MIIHNLHFVGIAIPPYEANPPLAINANAVLSGAVAAELFEAIAGHGCQVSQNGGGIENGQFSQGRSLEALKAADSLPMKKPFSLQGAERPDHPGSI